MDEKIRQKMAAYKELAKSQTESVASTSSKNTRPDSLSQLIKSKKDADDFMAELESAIKRAK